MFGEVKKIRVLIVDDHAGMRDGIRAVLDTQPDMEVAGEASDGEEAVREFGRVRPDVSLVDFNLPKLSGPEVIVAIRAGTPEARCVIITAVNDDNCIRRAFDAGAVGYLHKDVLRRELLPAIRAVHAGRQYIPPEIAKRLRREG